MGDAECTELRREAAVMRELRGAIDATTAMVPTYQYFHPRASLLIRTVPSPTRESHRQVKWVFRGNIPLAQRGITLQPVLLSSSALEGSVLQTEKKVNLHTISRLSAW